MGLLDEITKVLGEAGGGLVGGAGGGAAAAGITAISGLTGTEVPLFSLLQGRPAPIAGKEEEGGAAAAFDAFILQQAQDVSTQFKEALSSNNPEALQAAEEAQALLSSQVNRREEILASFTANARLQEILSTEDDSEVSMAEIQAFATSEEGRLAAQVGDVEALTPEETEFQNLLNRNTQLDVLLKEQQLAAAQRQQEFAGIMSLMEVLPSKQRADVVATLLESPIGQEFFFGEQQPTTSGIAGGGAVSPLTAADNPVLAAFRGGR